jgi:hypothetical protein
MSSFFYKYRLLNPEIYLSEMVRKYAQGKLAEHGENVPFFQRAKVLAIDKTGAKLENAKGEGSVEGKSIKDGKTYAFEAKIGPDNPKYSIKARLITDQSDAFTSDDELRVYWPLFPNMGQDISVDEFVYVFWEDADRKHGIWVSKCPAPNNIASVNRTQDDKNFDKKDQDKKNLTEAYPDTAGKKQENEAVDNSSQSSIYGSSPDGASLTGLDYSQG